MCHMVADTREELYAMVDLLGIDRKWIQKKDTLYEHFDISKGKRAEAIRHGAVPISSRELVKKLRSRRTSGDAPSSLQENKGASLPGLGLHGDP